LPPSRRKQVKRMTDFSGGINNSTHPRNIKDNELFWAGGFNTNEEGRLVPGGTKVPMDSGTGGIGTMTDDDLALGNHIIDIARGYHTFRSDYDNLYAATSATQAHNSAAASSPTVPRNYSLLVTSGDADTNASLFVHEHGRGTDQWNATPKDLSWTDGAKPFFYHVGDGIRIANAALDDNPWHLSYVVTDWEAATGGSSLTNEADVHTWVLTPSAFTSPTTRDFINDLESHADTGNTATPNMTGFSPAYQHQYGTGLAADAANQNKIIGTAFCVDHVLTYFQAPIPNNDGELWLSFYNGSNAHGAYLGTPGTWHTGSSDSQENIGYRFYASWVYDTGDGKYQESVPTKINDYGNKSLGFGHGDHHGDTVCTHDDRPFGLNFVMSTFLCWNAGGLQDWRIKGLRVYYDKLPGGTRDLYLLQEYLIEKGVRKSGTSIHADFTSASGDRLYNGGNFIDSAFVDPPTEESFFSVNGYKSSSILTAKYKTACYVNGRTYVGNLIQSNRNYPDGLLRSPALRPDIFPEENFRDLEANDGDEIAHLEAFADRLFVFKKNRVIIVNISQADEFIEEEVSGGAKGPWQVVKSDFGLAWINTEGLFIFDGKKIKNVALGKISIDGGGFGKGTAEDINVTANQKVYWKEFVSGEYAMLGFDPKSAKLCIMRTADETNAFNTDCYFYSLKNKSFNFISKAWEDNRDYVNFVTDPNRNLCTAYCENQTGTLQFVAWDDIPSGVANEDNNYILTKDYTFENEGAQKSSSNGHESHERSR